MRLLGYFLFFVAITDASPDVVSNADVLYQHTEYENSLHALAQDHAPGVSNFLLTGKNYFMLRDYKKAVDYFEKALSESPASSEAELWLGRAWGRRAEGGSPFALIYAGRTRQCFEKAVALDPHNREAKNDLFDFYLNAPAILGGGIDKADALAKSIAGERPAEFEFEEAQIAEKRNDFTTAETHLRRAVELAPGESGRIVDLARFIAKRGRLEESDRLFAQARKLSPNKPGVAFAEARTDIENHRNVDQARKLLQGYLQASLTPDDPSRQEAEKLLQRAGG
jgi:tetratricopeptide (TPR) repeat protein